jgi:type VI secretion system protein ImpA
VNATGAAFYIDLIADLEGAVAEFDGLATALYEKAGRDAPPTSNIRDLLRKILDAVTSFSKDLIAREQPALEAAQSEGGTAAGGGGSPIIVAQGAISGREDALRTLSQVAEYFRKTEPHSPIAQSLDDLVRRARLPFAELLQELLGDDTQWRTALSNAGIRPPAQE